MGLQSLQLFPVASGRVQDGQAEPDDGVVLEAVLRQQERGVELSVKKRARGYRQTKMLSVALM